MQELIASARQVTQFLGDGGLQRITLETDRQLFQLSPLGSGWSLAAVPKSGSRAGTAEPPPPPAASL